MSCWSCAASTLVTVILCVAGLAFGCTPPFINEAIYPDPGIGDCSTLKRICVDDGYIVYGFDDELKPLDPYGNKSMGIQSGLWNFPTRGGSNSDALVGHQPNFWVPVRRVSRREANPALLNPVFSTCTLPVIMIQDWPYNMGEVLAQLAAVVDVLLHKRGMADHRVTLVIPTPSGLAMTPYHHALIAPHSLYAPVSFDDMSTRAQRRNSPVPWSEEGHVSCFERAVYCKFYGFPQSAVETARTLLRGMLPLLPTDPLGFGAGASGQPAQPLPPLGEDTTFRVAIEARSGAARSFKNLHAIMDECAEVNKRGFRAGRFTSIACRVLHTGDTPDLHGLARFYANIGAVRSAHLLVVVHGAGAVNAAFMEEGGHTGLLEIRPCRFGTKFCGWPNAYMHAQLQRTDFSIRFFAFNLADSNQCAPPDYEAEHLANPDTTPLRGPEDHRARDQHVMPNPRQLLEYLRHVGTMLSDQAAYDEANRADKRHAYALSDGLVYGSLCVEDEEKLQTMEKQPIVRL